MNTLKKTIFFILFICSYSSQGGILNYSEKQLRNINNFPIIAKGLIERKMYFTSIPFLKEYISTFSKKNSVLVDRLIDEVVGEVGIKQFEVLPIKILRRSKAPVIQYILAKKFFRMGKYQKALNHLQGVIPYNHSIKPFALLLEGSIFSIRKKHKSSLLTFKRCMNLSLKRKERESYINRQEQLDVNHDYCLVGKARTLYAMGKFDEASRMYMDLPKHSKVWPEILFEEAWTSFFIRDYNRTLGKLVTYKAPVFNYIFNPEIEVLTSLTYMELCLWEDSKYVVDKFYKRFQPTSTFLKKLLRKNRKNYKFYYRQAIERQKGKVNGGEVYNKILKSILKDPVYIELYSAFIHGDHEMNFVASAPSGSLKKVLGYGLKESLKLQRDLIGFYVRRMIKKYNAQIEKSLVDVSYISLEVLSRKKQQVYGTKEYRDRERGDFLYLKQNERQYFWDFVGEFWADELGDYVFALKTECKR